MADNSTKRCPACKGEIDIFGSCKRCGREWSATLEPDELAQGLPEGQQHPAEVKKIGSRQPRRSRFTKSGEELAGKKFVSMGQGVAARYAGWQIDADNDDETEIIRKRSLMHTDSRKTYNALGLAMRANTAQKGAILWLSRLWEFLSDEEQKILAPTLERLKQGFADVQALTSIKVTQAAEMEHALDKAHYSARRARLRLMDTERKKADRNKLQTGEDTEGFSTPEPAIIDPKLLVDPAQTKPLTQEEMIEQAKQKLANLDYEKRLKKRMDLNRSKDSPESE